MINDGMKLSQTSFAILGLMLMIACAFVVNNKSSESKEKTLIINNPIFKDLFTADPAPLVHNGVFYLYTGHNEQIVGGEGFVMNEWLLFSTTDMTNWTKHGPVLSIDAFDWASGQAWAAHVVEKNGKFYYYVSIEHATIRGKAIGVAVSDSPKGPFTDAIGEALITNDMTNHIDL